MISINNIGYDGRLGNQLFELFTGLSYAIDNKKQFYWINTNSIVTNNLENILKSFSKYIIQESDIPKDIIKIQEKSFNYNELESINNNNNVELTGYFQSYKYFDHN